MTTPPTVALVDDHILVREGMVEMVAKFGYKVLFNCGNAAELATKLQAANEIPDVILMDINLGNTNGFDATLFLKQKYPLIKVLAVTMDDKEVSVIRMLVNGAVGYVLKGSSPSELKKAIDDVHASGYHLSGQVTGKLLHEVMSAANGNGKSAKHSAALTLKDRQKQFLGLACSDLTYKQIAKEMSVSERTVDGYREELFEKFDVKSRVALALYAVKTGLVNV